MEIWKDIENYEGLYQVSNLGRVRRVDSEVNTGIKNSEKRICKGGMLKQNLKRNGYLSVDLSKEQKVKTISVHRLVAKAFILNDDENKNQVNHINANKQDNRVENLEWVTPQENHNHAKENGLHYAPNKKQILCVELNKTFESSYSAAEYLNNKYFKNSKQIKNVAAKIRSAACGFQTKAYDFTWKYCI